MNERRITFVGFGYKIVALAETGKDVQTLERGLSRGLRRALDSVVLDGAKLSDALGIVANSVINSAYSAAVKPVRLVVETPHTIAVP